jgi:hypothetical protein
MNPNQVGRLTMRIITRLESYKRLQLSIEMEYSMCASMGAPFTLPVDRLLESCYNEAAIVVARHIKRPVGEVLWCLEHYLHN